MTRAKKKELKSIGDVTEKHADLRIKWATLHETRATLLQAECEKLSSLSKGLIQASISRAASTAQADAKLRAVFKGSGVRVDRKLESLFGVVVTSEDPVAQWFEFIDELGQLASLDPAENSAPKLPHTSALDACGFTSKDKAALARKLTFDDCLTLWLTELQDLPVFEYRARADEYIPFTEASAGQQATALMHVLLGQGGPPIVIDQPEDDLDNQVINDIVEDIWKAKGSRQIIFSSHNANLVVNGDAELLVCCGYQVTGEESAGEIRRTGAIDIQEVRDEITTIMEGGEEAFSLRKAKYGF